MNSWIKGLRRNWALKRALKKSQITARSAIGEAASCLDKVRDECEELLKAVDSIEQSAPKLAPAMIEVAEILQSHTKPVRKTVQTELRNFEEGMLAKGKSKRLNTFTAVFFGRTMAGKSTIREAITGGDGTTIGKGAQRTTRDIREYSWNYISLIDTPGFGAFEGDEDRQLAFTKIDESDVVIFLLSSDGIQEESFREMANLNRLRKPVLFVLNVKKDLTKEVWREQFLENPEHYLTGDDYKAHHSRVTELVAKHFPSTLHEIRLIPVHAQAAWLADQKGYEKERNKLIEASRIVGLLQEIEDELLTKGPKRRIQTIVGGSAIVIDNLAKELDEGGAAFAREAALFNEKSTDLNQKLKTYSDRFSEKSHTAVVEHFSSLDIPGFVEKNISKKKIKELWEAKVKELNTDEWVGEFCEGVAKDVEEILKEFQRQLEVDFDLLLSGSETSARIKASRPIDWKKVARFSAAALAVTGAVLLIVTNPAGWLIGTIAGVGIALTILSKFLPGKKEAVDKAKREARLDLEKAVKNHEKEYQQRFKDWFRDSVEQRALSPIRQEITKFHQGIIRLSESAHKHSNNLQKISSELTKRHSNSLNLNSNE